ncbi:MAG: MBL fold metallo-hydrolase [Rhodoferax sp.]|nr:MBL fold metallo-hydrolase [Rhodoferax sp.]
MTIEKTIGKLFAATLLCCIAAFEPVANAADPNANLDPNRDQPMINSTASAQHATTITLLGTMGGPPEDPSGRRAQTASLITVNGVHYLIDAGGGVVRRLVKDGLSPYSVKKVFITHNHLDHTAELAEFMSSSWFNGWFFHDKNYMDKSTKKPFVEIYGPPDTAELFDGAMKFLSVSARIFQADATGAGTMKMPEEVFAVRTIEKPGKIFDDGNVKVTAVENTHYSVPLPSGLAENGDLTYAYRFDTPSGSVVFTGDSGPSANITKLAEGADVLVSEVLDFNFLIKSWEGVGITKAPNPDSIRFHMEHQHLSPEEVGKMAAKAHVKTVILNHIVPGDVSPQFFVDYVAAVKKYYSGPVIMGQDLFQYSLIKQ